MDTIKLAVQFGKEKLIFCLKVISVAEEKRLRSKFIGKTEEEMEKDAYSDNVKILTDYEAEQPQLVTFGENSEEIKTAIVTKDYFCDENTTKGRIAEYAVRGFLVSLEPDLNFF